MFPLSQGGQLHYVTPRVRKEQWVQLYHQSQASLPECLRFLLKIDLSCEQFPEKDSLLTIFDNFGLF